MDREDGGTADFLHGLWAPVQWAERCFEGRILGGRPRTVTAPTVVGLLAAIGTVGEGENVYFGVCPRKLGEKGGRAALLCGTAAWCDVDVECGAEEVRVLSRAYGRVPTVVVRSGHGYHLYWFLDRAVEFPDGMARLERLNRRIAMTIGGDTACGNADRILRLPGTTNWKRADAPVACGLLGERPGSWKRYTMEELESGLPVADVAQVGPAWKADGEATSGEGRGVFARGAVGSRNVQCFKLAARLRSSGASVAVALAAAAGWNSESEEPLPAGELEATVRNAYKTAAAGGAGDIEEGGDCWCPRDLVEGYAEEVGWTVSGLVPTRGVTIFSGEGGIGKSFFALDMAVAVASGGKWAERLYCEQGAVVYVDLENDEGTLGRRMKQIGIGRGIDVRILPIYVPKRGRQGVDLGFDTEGGRGWLRGVVEEYHPKLVVIDSLIAAHQGDENSNTAMRQLVGGLDVIARQADMGMLVVHHQRKRGVVNDAGQLMRGASDLRNAVVSHFAGRRLRADMVGFEHDKCRPARPVDPFVLRIADCEDGVRIEKVENPAAEEAEVTAQAERVKRVLGRLASGPCRVGELALVVGGAERTLQRTLQGMVDRGVLVRVGQRSGMYALAEATQVQGELRTEDEE